MHFCSSKNDRGISGVVFDLMALFFLQRARLTPILNEDKLGQPLNDFLDLPAAQQQKLCTKLFRPFHGQPDLPRLMFDLLMYYACRFDPSECIQVTSKEPVHKDRLGTKQLRVVGEWFPEVC